MKSFGTLILFSLLLVMSCTRPPDFPPEPVITFGSMTNSTLLQNGQDSTFVVLNFTDGDGDIGFNSNEPDLFLKDTRSSQNATETLALPMVPELGTENGISGEIRFTIPSSCCVYPPEIATSCLPAPPQYPEYQLDTIIYEVFVKDRAGNQSNTLTLEQVVLICE